MYHNNVLTVGPYNLYTFKLLIILQPKYTKKQLTTDKITFYNKTTFSESSTL